MVLGIASGLVALVFVFVCLVLRTLYERQEDENTCGPIAVAFFFAAACGCVAGLVSLCAWCVVAAQALVGRLA